MLDRILKKFHPRYVSLIAPEISRSLNETCQETDKDFFYVMKAEMPILKSGLKRNVKRAQEELTLEHGRHIQNAHQELMAEFIDRVEPSLRIRNLLSKMAHYTSISDHVVVLNARDHDRRLSAFYIVDFSAKSFATYVIGYHSKKNYVPGASDLLCFEMIRLSSAKEKNTSTSAWGLTTASGGSKKNGGAPQIRYEMCELVLKKPSFLDVFRA